MAARVRHVVEITSAMIEAGLGELWTHPIMEPTEAEMRVAVREVVEAMFRASETHAAHLYDDTEKSPWSNVVSKTIETHQQ